MEIIFKKVSFTYPGDKEILKNIDITIKNNKITFIMGKNGSGKTTLIQLLNGLLIPTSGVVQIDEFTITSKEKNYNLNKLRSKVGVVFQFPEDQFFNFTVKEEISYSLKQFNYRLNEIDKHVLNSLKLVGLNASYRDLNPFKLSKGEMRKVAIASILAFNPKVIVLDEPTIGLDNNSKENLIKVIKKLKNKYNKTIIIVSHDLDFINALADNIVLLNNGEVFLNDSKNNVFKNKKTFDKIGLKVPNTILFAQLVKEKHNIKLPYRNDIDDLIKDIYRNAK